MIACFAHFSSSGFLIHSPKMHSSAPCAGHLYTRDRWSILVTTTKRSLS